MMRVAFIKFSKVKKKEKITFVRHSLQTQTLYKMSDAAADDVLRAREMTTEETDLWRKRSRAMEMSLKEKLKQELDSSKTAEARVTETWRKVIRLAKVSAMELNKLRCHIYFKKSME